MAMFFRTRPTYRGQRPLWTISTDAAASAGAALSVNSIFGAPQLAAVNGGNLAGDAEMIHCVGTVARDVEIEYRLAVVLLNGVDGDAGHRKRMRQVFWRFSNLHVLPQPTQNGAH